MYSRYELEEGFKRSKGERAAIAYLKKKESERFGRMAKLKEVVAWVSAIALGIAWWAIIILM